MILSTLWWLGFWTAIGLCVGSFLNVVIFRLPRGRSLRAPLWSACPFCEHRIRWYDNLPIVSFIMLGGRCRDCGVPIATRYAVVEAAMALIVLALIDAFFVGNVRAGIGGGDFGLTEQLALNWPILLAHVILFACLLPMSVIDMEHYWVDVRFTNVATVAGFLLHALWTPRASTDWIRPLDTTAVTSLAAVGALGLVWIVLICQPHVETADESEDEECDESVDLPPIRPRGQSLMSPTRVAGWIGLVLVVGLFVVLAGSAAGRQPVGYKLRTLLLLLFFFGLIVSESSIKRESDQEIIAAIDEERSGARVMVLQELAVLLPVVLFALIAFCVMRSDGPVAERASEVLHWRVPIWNIAMLRGWSPLYGLATAASGYVIGGALGWVVRIGFTLVFGKEAFGSGDVHLMAAAGCVAGWPVVLLGFILTGMLALLGWLIVLPFKRSRALPLAPWLSLSFLIVTLFYNSIIRWPIVERVITVVDVLILRNSQG